MQRELVTRPVPVLVHYIAPTVCVIGVMVLSRFGKPLKRDELTGKSSKKVDPWQASVSFNTGVR